MRNIEFKAELRNIEAARRQCMVIGAERIGELRQTDDYFKLVQGRLKRRSAPGEPVEWIKYERTNVVQPRESDYDILSDTQARRRWGTHSLRPWLTVIKTRELWLVEDVRIHLDEVEELGCFIEFEAVVSKRFDERACRRAVEELRELFSPLLGEPIAVGYSDLMEQEMEEQTGTGPRD